MKLAGEGSLVSGPVFLLHGAYWGCWLMHGFFLMRGFGHSAFGAATAFVVAPVLGFLAFVAPAGAGVRDAIVVALVAPVTGVSNAVAISLISRAASLVADVLSWLLSLAWQRR